MFTVRSMCKRASAEHTLAVSAYCCHMPSLHARRAFDLLTALDVEDVAARARWTRIRGPWDALICLL